MHPYARASHSSSRQLQGKVPTMPSSAYAFRSKAAKTAEEVGLRLAALRKKSSQESGADEGDSGGGGGTQLYLHLSADDMSLIGCHDHNVMKYLHKWNKYGFGPIKREKKLAGSAILSSRSQAKETVEEVPRLASVEFPSNIGVLQFDTFIKSFRQCQWLTCVNLSWTYIKVIPRHTFADCKEMVEINLPPSITTVGNAAFRGCTALSKLTFPEEIKTTLKFFGVDVFAGCDALPAVVKEGWLHPETPPLSKEAVATLTWVAGLANA